MFKTIHGFLVVRVDITRTIPIKYIDHLFQPLEDAICFRQIPTITSHGACSSQKQEISLPCHLGGLGPKDV